MLLPGNLLGQERTIIDSDGTIRSGVSNDSLIGNELSLKQRKTSAKISIGGLNELLKLRTNQTGDVQISLDSDLGKRLNAYFEQKARSTNQPIHLPDNEFDNYVPIYNVDKSTPWPKSTLVGYRHKTPLEMLNKNSELY